MTSLLIRFVWVNLVAFALLLVVFIGYVSYVEQHYASPRLYLEVIQSAEKFEQRLKDASEEEIAQELAAIGEELDVEVELLNSEETVERIEQLNLTGDGPPRVLVTLPGSTKRFAFSPKDDAAKRVSELEDSYLFAALGAMVGIVLLTGIYLSLPLARQLAKQQRTLNEIAEGNLDARVHANPRGPLGKVSERINLMADRIQQLVGSYDRLIQTVSHETRTPIARLQFSLEMLEKATDDQQRRSRVDSMQDDIDEIENLLGELLTYQSARARTRPLPTTETPLAGLHHLFQEIASRTHEGNEIDVTCAPLSSQLSEIVVSVNERMIRRAIDNLVRNAARFAHSRVEISLAVAKGHATIAVSDDGPGIPSDVRDRVFEPFYRIEGQQRGTDGSGLGLAIAKEIVEQHGGQIVVTDSDLGGARFEVVLPLHS